MWKVIITCLLKNAANGIALLALIVSLWAICLSRQDFIATHRPYVYAISRKTDKDTMDLNSVFLRCLNAPAQIISRQFNYVVVETKGTGEEKIIKTIPWKLLPTLNSLLYPSVDNQVFCAYDFRKEIQADPNNVKLRRKVRIEYKELSSDRTYFYEGNWDYNTVYDLWEDKDMFAN